VDTQAALVRQLEGTVASDQAQVDAARLQLSYTQVTAPFAGRLGLRQADKGNVVGPSDANGIVTINQVRPIDAAFSVPEAHLPQMRRRMAAGEELPVELWDREQKRVLARGRVMALDNAIDPATGTIKVKAAFANEDGALYPNQFVNVRLRVETRQQATLIPSAAVQFGARGTFVFVLGEGDKVQIRDVRIAASDGATSLVEEGVKVGERLVLEGIDKLKDGSQVQVIGNEPGALAQPQAQAAQKQGA